jgi:competence protein ComEA
MDAAHTAIFKRSFSNFTNTAPVTKKDSTGPSKDFQDRFDENTAPMPDIININTADSATLVRLKGIGPATAHKILLRRTEKGPFTAIVQLKECGRIPSATFSIIAPHLSVR